MKNFIYNIGYYLKEGYRTIKMSFFSYFISLLSTILILFLLALVITVASIGERMVNVLSQEAEISAYFIDDINSEEILDLVNKIEEIDGVWNARIVEEEEAFENMEEMLGNEAEILELFDENPFEAFIEIGIHIEQMGIVLEELASFEEIDYIRDNREVLERIKDITSILSIFGYLVFVAVGITTLIILSHLIRQGIYINREQINTLRLLGAPSSFIGTPYILIGFVLMLVGGLVATGLIIMMINNTYGQISGVIPFIPLPAKEELVYKITIAIPSLSVFLGIFGSLLGLGSIRGVDS